ncbi:hypothetical protein [Natronococcus sp. A-GB7]|uniref:hypothetical protein n=1 Tax=Natronococcus sp. A-GB7 TaxID=3037649 RepID=UPI00241D51F8|nr:hypothetical protein [Natronococcus sp. A-GB7]MDG5818229.1 hypothetical protein [Natronococcus sp. A-GB7]
MSGGEPSDSAAAGIRGLGGFGGFVVYLALGAPAIAVSLSRSEPTSVPTETPVPAAD